MVAGPGIYGVSCGAGAFEGPIMSHRMVLEKTVIDVKSAVRDNVADDLLRDTLANCDVPYNSGVNNTSYMFYFNFQHVIGPKSSIRFTTETELHRSLGGL